MSHTSRSIHAAIGQILWDAVGTSQIRLLDDAPRDELVLLLEREEHVDDLEARRDASGSRPP